MAVAPVISDDKEDVGFLRSGGLACVAVRGLRQDAGCREEKRREQARGLHVRGGDLGDGRRLSSGGRFRDLKAL